MTASLKPGLESDVAG